MKAKILFFLSIFATAIIFIGTKYVYAATTPSLGTAATFGILASTYTNTVGGTTITGDLGYTTGPAVAPTVTGTTHIADATYSSAGTDQGAAKTNLDGQACTHTWAFMLRAFAVPLPPAPLLSEPEVSPSLVVALIFLGLLEP